MSVSFCILFFHLFPIELLVEQENKQVDVDGGPVEELHHRHTFILQLEEILSRDKKKSSQDDGETMSNNNNK